MKQFYLYYPKLQALPAKLRSALSWTHYVRLLSVKDEQERMFYSLECAENRWSTRQLDREISSSLYERIALSRVKA